MSAETQMFIASILCGIAAILLWDIFYGLRKVFFKGIVFNVLFDILWWYFTGTIFVRCMWNYGSMRLRFFVFLGSLIGAFLYYITLSGVLKRCFCKIFEIFYKIIQFILKILLTPAAFLYKILVVCIIKRIVNKNKRGSKKWNS